MQLRHLPSFSPQRQHGAVLFVTLVFLVLLTLLALTASSSSVLQERMTGGTHNAQLALMGSETSLRGVEWYIWNKSNGSANKNGVMTSTMNCGGQGLDDACYRASNVGRSDGLAVWNAGITQFRNDPVNAGPLGRNYGTNLTSLSGSQQTASLAAQPQQLTEDIGVVLPPGAAQSGQGGRRDNVNGSYAENLTLHSYRNTARSSGGNAASLRATESYFVALPPSS